MAPAAVLAVVAFATLAALLIVAVTAVARRHMAATVTAILVIASVAVTVMTLAAPVAAPGYALDPETHVPVGDAFPSYLRILTPPFNIAGAFALVFGALYSAYIFMPKRRLLRTHAGVPVVSQVYRAFAVVVNFFASIPAAFSAARDGRLHSRVPATILIALGGFIPGVTSGLSRFGITWAFFLGELLGVVLIFIGFLASVEVFSDLRIPFTHVVIGRRRAGAEGGDGGAAA